MTDNKKESLPDYFVLNPLTTNKKLGDFFFKNDYNGYKYYPCYIHGATSDVTDETINDFIKHFFTEYIDDYPSWEVTDNNKLK